MPPFDVQKHPVDQSLNKFADQRLGQAQSILAKSLPCSVDSVESNGTIVTVKIEVEQPDITFPMIKLPVYGPEFLRWPLKKGDKGVMLSAGYYLGEMSGLGKGKADLTPQLNLASGVFFPIGNAKFSDNPDPDATVIYGREGGVVIRGVPPPESASSDPEATNGNGSVELPPAFGGGVVPTSGRANVELPPAFGGGTVDTGGSGATGQQQEKGGKLVVDDEGMKFYVDGQLKFIVDANGMRMVGGPRTAGGDFGVVVTDHGTQIDNLNWLQHVHQGVTVGSANSQKINELVSPT